MALLLSRWRATSRRPTATSKPVAGTGHAGRASSCTARRSGSWVSAASACSSRSARAFGMRSSAVDPFVNADDGAPVRRAADADARGAGRQSSDFVLGAKLPEDAETIDLERRRPASVRSPDCASINTGRGGLVDEALAASSGERHRGRRARHVRRASRRPSRPCSRSTTWSSRRTSARRRPRRRTRPGSDDRRAGRARAARRLRAVRGQRRGIGGVRDGAAVPPARRAARPAVHRRSRAAHSTTLEITYEGEIADYDCRVLTLSVLKGVLGTGLRRAGVVRQRAAARREARHLESGKRRRPSRDYVNLVSVRGEGGTHVAATLFGKQEVRASSASTSTSSTCRPRATCWSCATRTFPA